jgi:hypothetical protein
MDSDRQAAIASCVVARWRFNEESLRPSVRSGALGHPSPGENRNAGENGESDDQNGKAGGPLTLPQSEADRLADL